MNKVILIGNLTKDPELKTTPSGVSVCQFTLAVNRRFTNAQGVREADFIPVVTWRQQADLCARYLSKGRKCAVVGMIQTRSYDAQDGTKRYVTEVVADEVEFLGSNPNGNSDNRSADPGFPPEPPQSFGSQSQGFTEAEDDELPF